VLEFLVTSKVRRRLLEVLWRESGQGSVTDLARRAGVGFAGAYRELHAMHRFGLVVADRGPGAESFRANRDHPLAAALQALVGPTSETPADTETARTRGGLRALGAPILAEPVEELERPVEEVLVRGVVLAHRDPAVARALPVCIFKVRERLDPARLQEHARRLRERHGVGFFLDLTAELSGDRVFLAWAKPLRDHRRTLTCDFFFVSGASEFQRRLAEERTPDVARRWGFRMNMDVESFRSLFERFVHAA
jgi:hypothetical protein